MINKKATEKIFSIWWFVCLAITGAAIVVAVTLYFGAFIDVREIEVSQMQEKILDCAIKNGYLNENLISLEKGKIFQECGLNANQYTLNSKFFFNLTIYNTENQEKNSFVFGDDGQQQDCIATYKLRAKNYPKCLIYNKTVNRLNSETYQKENYRIYLLVSSNNYGNKKPILQEKKSDE